MLNNKRALLSGGALFLYYFSENVPFGHFPRLQEGSRLRRTGHGVDMRSVVSHTDYKTTVNICTCMRGGTPKKAAVNMGKVLARGEKGRQAGIMTAPGVLPRVLRFGLKKQVKNAIILWDNKESVLWR
jgi:hypothetical protein